MGVSVYIDGRPAECREDYNEVIGQLGAAPDESPNRFELWTTQPRGRVTSRSVWLNPGSDSGRAEWLADGGATLQSSQDYGGSEDYLSQGKSCIKVRSAVTTPTMPVVLAAFLAHDFPLVDAVMLARAYRGAGWSDCLSDYPVPVGCPTSRVAFAKFPNSVGHRANMRISIAKSASGTRLSNSRCQLRGTPEPKYAPAIIWISQRAR